MPNNHRASRSAVVQALADWEEGKPCPICHAAKDAHGGPMSKSHISGHAAKKKRRRRRMSRSLVRPRAKAPRHEAASVGGGSFVRGVVSTAQAIFLRFDKREKAYLVIAGPRQWYLAYPVRLSLEKGL